MTRAIWVTAASILLAGGMGCFHAQPYPTPYDPYSGYPVAPSGTYPVAPGGYPSAPGSFVNPAPTAPGTLGPSTAPLGAPSGPGPTIAPPLNTTPGGSTPPDTFQGGADPGGGVPNYNDPTSGDYGTNPNDGYAPPEDAPFGDPGASLPPQNNIATTPTNRPDYFSGLNNAGMPPTDGAATADPSFGIQPAGYETPDRTRPAPLGGTAGSDQAQNPEWHGFDKTNYRWLRGVIDYDPKTKQWGIIYDPFPEPNDQFAGYLTLLNHPRLAEFKNNDVVEIKGQLDASAGQDLLGKPYYRIMDIQFVGRYE